jgi:hypothetical protein
MVSRVGSTLFVGLLLSFTGEMTKINLLVHLIVIYISRGTSGLVCAATSSASVSKSPTRSGVFCLNASCFLCCINMLAWFKFEFEFIGMV